MRRITRREAGAGERVEAAVAALEAARARKKAVIAEVQPRIDALPSSSTGPAIARQLRELEGVIQRAFDEEVDAEDALARAIRDATPGGEDPDESHSFLHRDGRLFIALPEGLHLDYDRPQDRERECRDEGVIVIGAGRQGGATAGP